MPPIIFFIYPYINASVKTLFKQKQSSADLIHGLITKSDHSGGESWSGAQDKRHTIGHLLAYYVVVIATKGHILY